MTTNATIDSKLVRAIADEQLAKNVFMIEWLVQLGESNPPDFYRNFRD
ncbi:hypothetical protein WH8501_02930 [Crocosphaera watsonii WH 8501]|nr:hypothetical protein [Crocosphaera watsonii]